MQVNIIDADRKEHHFDAVSAIFYSEVDDKLKVHVKGEAVFEIKMGDVLELESYSR